MKASSFLLLLASAGFVVSVSAHAQQPNTSSQSLQYIDSAKNPKVAAQYEECGFACRYGRASEVVSIEVDYLSALLAALNDKNVSDDKKKELLGQFCYAKDTLDSCSDRFRLYAVNALARAQRKIAENNEMRRNLVDQNDVGAVKGQADPNEAGKMHTLPYAPKLQAVQAEAAADLNQRLTYLSSEEYLNEVATTLKAQPSQSDFIKMVEVSSDPKKPGAEKVWVPKRKADGSFEYDTAAYARAKAAYDVAQRDFQKNTGFAPTADLTAQVKVRSEALRENLREFATNKPSARTALLQKYYNQAHDAAVSEINDKLSKKSTAGNKRGLASGTGAPATGSLDLVTPEEGAPRYIPRSANGIENLRDKTISTLEKPAPALPAVVDQPGMAPNH